MGDTECDYLENYPLHCESSKRTQRFIVAWNWNASPSDFFDSVRVGYGGGRGTEEEQKEKGEGKVKQGEGISVTSRESKGAFRQGVKV